MLPLQHKDVQLLKSRKSCLCPRNSKTKYKMSKVTMKAESKMKKLCVECYHICEETGSMATCKCV